MKHALELWSHGKTFDEFKHNLKQYNNKSFLDSSRSFKITVETFNNKISQKDKINRIESLSFLEFAGPVCLTNPDNEFYYIEYYGLDTNNIPNEPNDYLFGRWISNGNRKLVSQMSLKTRKFIGNTSMDPLLSLLMVNQGLVKDHDLIFDPFVGSGSILCACAKMGSYVMGADIDYLMLHGKTKPVRKHEKVRKKDESNFLNMLQYNCDQFYIDVLVSDFSLSVWTKSLELDAIITDPPYGIRESTAKIEYKEPKKSFALTENAIHYPSTSMYQLGNLYTDLMSFASKHLKNDGRLVFWFPVYRNEYSEKMLPEHPGLLLVSNCEQVLSTSISRRLLTYAKISHEDVNETSVVKDNNFRER